MSTQHHMDEKEQDSALTTMSWIGGILVVVAIFAFFYLGM